MVERACIIAPSGRMLGVDCVSSYIKAICPGKWKEEHSTAKRTWTCEPWI